jgi:hypothetical protein
MTEREPDVRVLACVMQQIADGSGMYTHWPGYGRTVFGREFLGAIHDVRRTILRPTLILYESDTRHAEDHFAFFLHPSLGFTRVAVPPVEFDDLEHRAERIGEDEGIGQLFMQHRDRTYANLRMLQRYPLAGVTLSGFERCKGNRHIFARELLGQDRDARYEPSIEALFGDY